MEGNLHYFAIFQHDLQIRMVSLMPSGSNN